MEIKILERKDESRWDQFIMNHGSSTFFQQIGWRKVVEETYNHKPFYLFAEENGKIVGILPLFLVDSLIFGKRLVSIPYGSYAGICADGQDVVNALVSKAIKLSKDLNVKFLELRNMERVPEMPTNDKHVTMLLRLDQGEKAIWSNVRKGMKGCVKKAVKEELKIKLDSKNIDGFYSIYCRRMHELGTPVPPVSFFRNVLGQFSDTSIATIDYKGEILASQVLLFFKKTVVYGWGASSNHYSEWHPVHLLLWEVIRSTAAKGFEVFDFGRSTYDSGTYNFKKWWGAEPQPLFYQYYLNKTRDVPYIHPSNPKYSAAIKIWRNIPLPIANKLGPIVCKGLV